MQELKLNSIYSGDAKEVLSRFPDKSIDCCITSPPYYGLRDYGVFGQLGLEPSPEEYIDKLVSVFGEVYRVLKDNGTLWVNIGDSYAGGNSRWGGMKNLGYQQRTAPGSHSQISHTKPWKHSSIKPKDLIGIPWMLAFALRAGGWWLRQDIIWCLSGGAWVYVKTPTGEMPIMLKDMVRMNPGDVKLWNGGKWVNVLGWGESTDTSVRIELVLRSGERIGCTGKHLWPTQRGNIAANELKVGDIIQSCRLPEPEDVHEPRYLSNDLLWLLGLYLAEGSHSGKTIQLSLNVDEKKWIPRITKAVHQVGCSVSSFEYGNCLHVNLTGKVINAIIDDYIIGNNAKVKHLSTKTWSLSNDSLKCIMEGYLDGDGSFDEKNNRWRLGFCRNYYLERDLRIMSARLQSYLTINLAQSKYQNGEAKTFRGEWRWERSEHFNIKDKGAIIEIRKSRGRKFWDIAVEGEPHLFSLASGVLTHNCKPNCQPESITDRCTKSHEYIFLFSKQPKYYYDIDAIREPHTTLDDLERRVRNGKAEWKTVKAAAGGPYAMSGTGKDRRKNYHPLGRNKRSVWTVSLTKTKEAHFATYPEKLIVDCIKAGCPTGGVVLDPFMGSGTTAITALKHNRQFIGIELNPEYVGITEKRIADFK